jgi:hypothetical protein
MPLIDHWLGAGSQPSPLTMPMLLKGEFVIHAKTRVVGQVPDDVQLPRGHIANHKQEVVLKDGSRRRFPLAELQLADDFQVREFFGRED